MASVIYNGYKIIPAPFINIHKEYSRFGDNAKLGVTFVITLTGKVLPCKGGLTTESGYPNDTTSTDKFADVFVKLNALRELFEEDGKTFEIQTNSGTTPLRCFPVVKSFDVPEDKWVDFADYTIILETPHIFGLPPDEDDSSIDIYLNEASEEWVLEFNEQPQSVANQHTFRLQHNLSAAGKQVYTSDGLISTGLEQARLWVNSRMGLDTTYLYSTSGLGLLTSYSGYNHVRSENSNEYDGRYSINETWLIAKGNALEQFTVTTRTSLDNGLTTVGIEGNIDGLSTNNVDNITTTKWVSASGQWIQTQTNLYSRAQVYSGVTNLNTSPLSTQIGINPVNGTINYSYEYDTRPSNYIVNAKSEIITIHDINPADIFASIPIIGRSVGPILQDMNTITDRKRSINIELVMPITITTSTVSNMLSTSPKTSVDSLIVEFKSNISSNYNQVFTTTDEEDWSPKTGRYTRQVEWTYQNCT
jgi:hypothetical protein